MIVDINGNEFKQPALSEEGLGMLVTLKFHANPKLVYSNDQDITFLRDELTLEMILPKVEVDNIATLDKYNKFKAKLETLLHAVSDSCLALAGPARQSETEGVE